MDLFRGSEARECEARTKGWSKNGNLFVQSIGSRCAVALEDHRTVNSEWYAAIRLQIVLENVPGKRLRYTTILHHENASAHTATRTSQHLITSRPELTTHSRYSPDLALCEFFLFSTMKKQIRGQTSYKPEEAIGVYENLVCQVFLERSRQCFRLIQPNAKVG